MNGEQIKDFFERLIDDSVSNDLALDLMNTAKDEIETERDWEMLKKLDSSNTTTVGNTHTDGISLPDDFFTPTGIWVGDDEYFPVRFEEQRKWKDIGRRYYIDHFNSTLHLCGTRAESKTIYIFYIHFTDDLTLETSPIWPKLHKRIPYKMAELYLAGVDSDDVSRMMSPEHAKQAKLLEWRMKSWDARLKLKAMGGSTAPRTISTAYRDDAVGYE